MELERRYRLLLERHGNGDLSRQAFLARVARMAIACGVIAPALARFARPAWATPASDTTASADIRRRHSTAWS